MALFESSWDTQSSNAALSTLIDSAKSKSKGGKKDTERRKSKDGSVKDKEAGSGTSPSIDLDKLLKKMVDVGGGDKGKGKGQEREKRRGRKGKSEEGQSAGGGKDRAGPQDRGGKGGKGRKDDRRAEKKEEKGKSTIQESMGAELRGEKRKAEDGSSTTDKTKTKRQKKNKKDKTTQPSAESPKKPAPPASEPVEEDEQPEGMSELQQLVRKNLQGSKFRIINEKLYKSSSSDAQELMRAEPQMYTEYHIGFRHQTKSWPSNPVDLISTSLSASLPPRSLIVDLGCGDAQLAKTLVPQGLNVLSFDLVNDGRWVVDTDICTRVPLPGSERGGDEGAVVDACVCSLSLMSTNWIGCAREAWRVLRTGGKFVVAEVTSRFRETDEFVKVMSELGFELMEQTAPSTHFLLFEFHKVEREDISKSWEDIRKRAQGLLKPCEYKRR